ncbi:sensor histidine kinase [Hymenobacter terricola]|uniref:sensor histidine kinase n=1 Tax=Hymenobacter terricola TaxID=2819236 RepID=UPI001B30658B|nr:sensor histidine kinase [Hymenobacter terricola]
MKRLLLLLFFAAGFSGRAEPLYPLLSPADLASLRAQLRQSRPDTNRVLLLLRLGTDVLARSEELETDFRPAGAYGQQARALSETLHFEAGRIASLYALGQLQLLASPDTAGRGLIRQGLRLSRQQHRPRLEALGWYRLGNSYPRVAHYLPLSIACYQQARALFRQVGAQTEAAYILKLLADTHLLQGNTGQAMRELLQVVALYRASGHRELHYTYDLLLAANRQLGNYKEALRYGLATIESAQATHDTSAIAGFYSRVGGLYDEVEETPTALTYYRKALRNLQQAHSPEVIRMAGIVAKTLVRQGQARQALAFYLRTARPVAAADRLSYAQYLAELYVALKRYPLAEQQYAQVLALAGARPPDDLGNMRINQALGDFYLLTRRYGKARWHYQQALGESQRGGFLLGVSRLHLRLFQVDSAQHNFPAAIAHYQRYKALNDSIFNATKNKQLASLEIQYDTRKKEQNIALLTKQTQLQQSSIRQKDFQRNALLSGAVLLALLLGLSYNRYRLKQRGNQLLEAQQREINQQNHSLQHLLGEKEELLVEKDWMLKEIHHRVKNNLQVISSLLSTQSDFLHDPAALAAIRESENRVRAMALIHQKLYQSTSLAGVNMAEYIGEIASHLLESFECQGTVQTRLAVAPIELDAALATPIGLIINEALTNAFKYAFPRQRGGTVAVALAAMGGQRYQLTIADDGVGLPPNFNVEDNHTMGLTIMHGLSHQIDGRLRITQAAGVQVRLEFEVPAKTAAPAPV